MQAHTDHTHLPGPMDGFEIRNGGRMSVAEFVRQWGPCILTAVVVPGGIVIALLMLWNRWNQRRLAVQRA